MGVLPGRVRRTRALAALVTGALLLAAVGSDCEGTERATKLEGGQLRVSFEQGLLAVSAKSVDLQKVFKAVAGQTGIEIVLVGRPSEPIRVTVSVERQPVERAIQTILRASSFTGPAPPSYSFVYSGDDLRSVKILFPAPGSPARPSRSPENLSASGAQEHAAAEATPDERTTDETVSGGSVSDEKASDETQSIALEPGKIWGRPLTATERRQLISELHAAGIPTDALDEGQLSAVKRLKDLGLSLPEIREALPEPPGKR